MKRQLPCPQGRLPAVLLSLAFLGACGIGDADGRPGARYFQLERPNSDVAGDLEAYLGVPVDHRTATRLMQALGARCETSEMLIRIDDSVLCRYGQGQSWFENKIWKVTLNVDDSLVVQSVTVDSWRTTTLPRDI